jgi:hypothetical protein
MRSIPRVFNHRLASFLFAEKGEMPNSKGGKKSCMVGVTLSGLCFFPLVLRQFRNLPDYVRLQYL